MYSSRIGSRRRAQPIALDSRDRWRKTEIRGRRTIMRRERPPISASSSTGAKSRASAASGMYIGSGRTSFTRQKK